MRPLPSDSTTPSVPVSAIAKLAPDTAKPARRNRSRRCARAAIASSRGSSVRSGSTPGIVAEEDLADLAAVAVDRGHEDVRRPVVAELHDELGEVGLVRGDAGGLERLVEPDLLRRHRLDLDDLVAPASCTSRTTIALASSASRAQCTVPPRAMTCASSCTSSSGSRAMASVLIASPARRSSSQSSSSATTAARLPRMVDVAWPRLRRSCVSASAVRAAAGNARAGVEVRAG